MNLKLKTTALTIAAACVVVFLPLKGVAQDAKIAVVDTRALTLMSDEGKVASDKLQKRLDVIRVEMDKLRKDIEDKETRARTQERLLSAAAKAALASDIQNDKTRFERKAQDYEKEMNEMQGVLLDPVAQRVRGEIAAYVNEKGFMLLVDLSAENPNVVWANPANDITKEVLARVNENFKKSGGVAAPPAAPAAAPAAAPKPTTPSITTPPATQPRPPAGTPATPPATPPNK